jgi:hypothetical protein
MHLVVILTLRCVCRIVLCCFYEIQKVEKSAQITRFTTDLDRRDKEARVMQYYCEKLTKWAMDGYDRWVVWACSSMTSMRFL